MLSDLKRIVINEIESEKKRFIEISKNLYENPELGLKECKAVKLLTSELEKNKFEIEKCFIGVETAFKATLKGKSTFPTVALLAEYDALPEIGHGCGHNFIATCTLAAAVGLSKIMDGLDGELLVIGTPDEEGTGIGDDCRSKVKMVEKNAFNDVDAVIEIHPYIKNVVDVKFLTLDAVEISFKGKAAHAAAFPEKGINALDAVIQTFNGINALRQYFRKDVKVHGIITDGGKAPNIIPEKATAFFYVRSADREYNDFLLDKIKTCAEGAALATGAKLTFDIHPNSLESMRTNKTLAKIFEENLQGLGIKVEKMGEHEGMGSSDIGNISQVVPTIHPCVFVGSRDIVLHTKEFAEATISKNGVEAMMIAAKAVALTCVELFFNSEIVERARRECNRC